MSDCPLGQEEASSPLQPLCTGVRLVSHGGSFLNPECQVESRPTAPPHLPCRPPPFPGQLWGRWCQAGERGGGGLCPDFAPLFPPQYDEHVISPKEFVHLAGKSTLKDWKRAIRMNGIMLRSVGRGGGGPAGGTGQGWAGDPMSGSTVATAFSLGFAF